MNFIVLCSSRGTVFDATLQAIAAGSLHATCLGLITDRPDRGCILHAKKFNVPVLLVEKVKGEDREAYDRRVDTVIVSLISQASEAPLLACMGWMFILSPWFVSKWHRRILNVHPALLPKYPGAKVHDLVLAAGEKESGMTIHLIDEGVDTGTILVQKKCSVFPDDTHDTLKKRVQALECEWYPKVLEDIEQRSGQYYLVENNK